MTATWLKSHVEDVKFRLAGYVCPSRVRRHGCKGPALELVAPWPIQSLGGIAGF